MNENGCTYADLFAETRILNHVRDLPGVQNLRCRVGAEDFDGIAQRTGCIVDRLASENGSQPQARLLLSTPRHRVEVEYSEAVPIGEVQWI